MVCAGGRVEGVGSGRDVNDGGIVEGVGVKWMEFCGEDIDASSTASIELTVCRIHIVKQASNPQITAESDRHAVIHQSEFSSAPSPALSCVHP
jgi:hypothetical protein